MVVNSSDLVVTKKIQNCHFMSKFGTTANSNMQKTLFFLFEQNIRGGGGHRPCSTVIFCFRENQGSYSATLEIVF